MNSQKKKSKYYLNYLKKTKKFPWSIYHQAKHDMVHKMFISLPKNSRVLDAACGIGHVTGEYCDQYAIYGIDIEASAIQQCRQNYSGDYRRASVYKIPFRNNFFNLILFLDSIEHLTKPVLALKELARVLKSNGKILICTVNYGSPFWLILENSWHRVFGGQCKPFLKDVHPTRYTDKLLRQHTDGLFKEINLEKQVLNMELFYIGKKMVKKN